MTGPPSPVPERGPRRVLDARVVLDGAAWGMAAHGLMLPTGLVTVIYLTRTFGPAPYGAYAALVAVALFGEMLVMSAVVRPLARLAAASDDPARAAGPLLQVVAGMALLAAALLWALAGPIAAALNMEGKEWILRLAALDIPMAALLGGHFAILAAQGRVRVRAALNGLRWVLRLVFIVVLVEAGGGLAGAVGGIVLSSAVVLALARWRSGAAILVRAAIPFAAILALAGPLIVTGIANRALEGVALLFVKAFDQAEAAGWFAAAQYFAILPGIAGMALGDLLVAWSARLHALGDREGQRRAAGQVMRAMLWMGVALAAVAGCSREAVDILLGPEFAPAAVLMAILLAGGALRVAMGQAVQMLIGMDRAVAAAWLSSATLAAVVAGLLVAAPAAGALGAAWVVAVAAGGGCLAAMALLIRLTGAAAPVRECLRALPIAAAALGAGWMLPVEGVALGLAKLAAWPAAALGLLVLLGDRELPRAIRAFLRGLRRR